MAVSLFARVADHRSPASLASRLRARRLAFFADLLSNLTRPVTILDVGGTAAFWNNLDFAKDGVKVIILNVKPEESEDARFESIVGDARDLSAFESKSIDVVYSNSVIEHVGTFEDQKKMAAEVRRVAKRYFVQTPNAWFPIEPHFLFPGFQFMPLRVRTFLLTRFRLGWLPREPDPARAREVVDSIRLLTAAQMRSLFPEASIYRERFLGLSKSITTYHGW
jgi:hypothetical protein